MNNQMAKKPDKNNVREDRIAFEAIVDANGPEEQAMGWYYYLDDKMTFPFTVLGPSTIFAAAWLDENAQPTERNSIELFTRGP